MGCLGYVCWCGGAAQIGSCQILADTIVVGVLFQQGLPAIDFRRFVRILTNFFSDSGNSLLCSARCQTKQHIGGYAKGGSQPRD